MRTEQLPMVAEPSGRDGGRSKARIVAVFVLGASILVAVLGMTYYAGYAVGAAGARTSSPVYLDAEYDFIGAARTWPAQPNAQVADPFGEDQALLEAGRTVCTRAGDEGMSFGAMADLLQMTPHQTYVVMAEAGDKLCPSQGTHLADLMED